MKRAIVVFQIIICIGWVFSCDSPQKKAQKKARQVVEEWMGKEIKLPDHEMTYKSMGRDTACSEIWDKPNKIFVYIDSVGCTSCRLGLSRWKEIIDSCRTEHPDLGFLFVVHSVSYRRFERELRDAEFTYPIIYDYRNEFHKLNQFPPDPYRTYLLDKNNKITVIGSPVTNTKMWHLYKKMLSKGKT